MVVEKNCSGKMNLATSYHDHLEVQKATLTKLKHTQRPTPQSPPSPNPRKRQLTDLKPQLGPISRCSMIENGDDDEPTSVGHTLEADGDFIMKLSDGEGRGTQGSYTRSDPSDDEDMPTDGEEVELSMMFALIFKISI